MSAANAILVLALALALAGASTTRSTLCAALLARGAAFAACLAGFFFVLADPAFDFEPDLLGMFASNLPGRGLPSPAAAVARLYPNALVSTTRPVTKFPAKHQLGNLAFPVRQPSVDEVVS